MRRTKRLFKKLHERVSGCPEPIVFFFDEGRFGLQPVAGKLWGRKGVRQVATVQTGYANFYMYSAVNPATGENISLFLPWVNTAMMNVFLQAMQEALNAHNLRRSVALVASEITRN